MKQVSSSRSCFLEQFAVLLRVDERGAERLDLAAVIAAADAHDDAAVGDDVGHGVVLGEANRVPHRQDVEGATELQALGLGGKPEPELDQVREDFVALALEMMLGRPQHVEAELLHQPGDVARGEEGLGEPLVGIAPLVRRRAAEPDIVELDLADVKHMELVDHAFFPGAIPQRLCRGVNTSRGARQRPHRTSRAAGLPAHRSARTRRVKSQIDSARQPIAATTPATGQADWPR